jgi:formylglycine-generating enzyme required for sulfatase activity
MMGSTTTELGHRRGEQQHPVTITQPFDIGTYEITQAQYGQVMEKNPSRFSRLGGARDLVKGMDTNSFPVEMVSWHEATRFCEKLSAVPAEIQAGRLYRLPTEAEWEYACRAGTTTSFHSGAELSSLEANVTEKSPRTPLAEPPGRTTTVGSYQPNAFGLYDMHGNVWEWCHDWFAPHSADAAVDPTGPQVGEQRIMRGGSYYFSGETASCCSANRNKEVPERKAGNLGFRVVGELPVNDLQRRGLSRGASH